MGSCIWCGLHCAAKVGRNGERALSAFVFNGARDEHFHRRTRTNVASDAFALGAYSVSLPAAAWREKVVTLFSVTSQFALCHSPLELVH